MKKERLENMHGGWFIGDFTPTSFRSSACEAACKHYKAGEYEDKHYHKIATEITLIVSGSAQMNDQIYKSGDIVIIEPGDVTDFKAIEATITMVIKIPSVKDDKYIF